MQSVGKSGLFCQLEDAAKKILGFNLAGLHLENIRTFGKEM
jgi:hypothetical protein